MEEKWVEVAMIASAFVLRKNICVMKKASKPVIVCITKYDAKRPNFILSRLLLVTASKITQGMAI